MPDGSIDPKKLMAVIDRYERIEEEKKGLAEDQKQILSQAQEQHGLDPKMIRWVVAQRKVDQEKRRILEADRAEYAHAAGLE